MHANDGNCISGYPAPNIGPASLCLQDSYPEETANLNPRNGSLVWSLTLLLQAPPETHPMRRSIIHGFSEPSPCQSKHLDPNGRHTVIMLVVMMRRWGHGGVMVVVCLAVGMMMMMMNFMCATLPIVMIMWVMTCVRCCRRIARFWITLRAIGAAAG
jgi:hypothetical protein